MAVILIAGYGVNLTSFDASGHRLVAAYGWNPKPNRIIATRPTVAFMELDCP